MSLISWSSYQTLKNILRYLFPSTSWKISSGFQHSLQTSGGGASFSNPRLLNLPSILSNSMGSTTVMVTIILIDPMSDQEATYIGGDDQENDDQIYPSFTNITPNIKAHTTNNNKEFRVVIREFEILKETYIVHTETQIYKVEIFLDNKEYQVVHRRFSDFEFLFDIVQERYPGLIIPGFLEKTLYSYFEAKISHLQKSIIDIRMAFLCRFFTKILNITVLKNSREIQNFLSVDEQFQIFKKSNLGNIKKKGIIGNFLTTAGNMFKTKKVDSKYQKFLEEGMNALKQLQKIEGEFAKYPESISQEVSLTKGLKESNPEIFQIPRMAEMFEKQMEVSIEYGQLMQNIVDELVYCQLDVKYYTSIIERRYEFKQNGDYKNVDTLEKAFESQKDGFLEFIKNQLRKVRKQLQEQVVQYKQKSKLIWKS